jgi:hypothetical protein
VPPVCPSSGEFNGTRRDETGRSGGTIQCEIKALAGNSATCLGFCFRLVTGSIPAASAHSGLKPLQEHSGPRAQMATVSFFEVPHACLLTLLQQRVHMSKVGIGRHIHGEQSPRPCLVGAARLPERLPVSLEALGT